MDLNRYARQLAVNFVRLLFGAVAGKVQWVFGEAFLAQDTFLLCLRVNQNGNVPKTKH